VSLRASRAGGAGAEQRRARLRGEAGFEAYYAAAFGARWPALGSALREKTRHVARLNAFAQDAVCLRDVSDLATCPVADGCYSLPDERAPARDEQGLLTFYRMDPASLLPVEALADCVGLPRKHLCQACVDTIYPTPSGEELYRKAVIRQAKGSHSCERVFDET